MPARRIRLAPNAAALGARFREIRARMEIPAEFPPDALAEAAEAAEADFPNHVDRTDLALLTIDPAGSTDLDQAFGAERNGDGFRVFYAIADVGSFVTPGGVLDRVSHERAQTLYSPDQRTLLYPPVLTDDAASLLPNQIRPSVLWIFELDAAGNVTKTDVVRARVRSRQQLDYVGAQRMLDEGAAPDQIVLMREIGTARTKLQTARGGISLAIPDEEVDLQRGTYAVHLRAPIELEDHNAQISLMTGMEAANIMCTARVGIVRAVAPPNQGTIERLRHTAASLGVEWPAGQPHAQFLSSPQARANPALLVAARALLRGATYISFDGEVPDPKHAMHSGVGAMYAHATAPLRRLGDRYVSEICLAARAGAQIPDWVRTALPNLPKELNDAAHRDAELERAIVDSVEASMLAGRVGTTFDATVLHIGARGAEVQLRDPPVRAHATGSLHVGQAVRVRLTRADPATGSVEFVAEGP